ncbi:hypothetical protein N0V90_012411 [Kalmusia sp. IMI 367209]|nr:hypothetical protein N0V90_012411 [Kalmusia sp. IMI 367209]
MPPPTQEWLAAQYKSGRFDLPNAHHHILYDKEHEALNFAFNKLAIKVSDESRLEKTSLVSRMQSQLPLGIPPIFVDHVYRILAYHSTAPFYQAPSTPLPQSLSLLDIQRALVWLLPDRHLQMSEMGNIGRMRTPADNRRLLFQSLATRSATTANNPSDEAARRLYAHRNAFDREHLIKHCGPLSEDDDDVLTDWAKINRDDDGDEMYHDLLDVLQANVPENYPYASPRDQLRPLAKELKVDFEFHSLAIPRDELTDFVQALIALQFETAQSSLESVDLQSLDEVVSSVMATFTCDDNDLVNAFPVAHDLIAWPAFDRGFQRIPHLLDLVYRVLIDILLDGKAVATDIRPSYEAPPALQARKQATNDSHVLSFGWMALTHALVPPVVDWETCHTVVRWHRSPGSNRAADAMPNSDAIWAHIHPQATKNNEEPPASILAFSGHDQASRERFVGGIMVAADHDGEDGNGGRDLVYSFYIFRLAPSVLYAKLLSQQWRQGPGGELAFGDTQTSCRFRLRADKMVTEIELPTDGQLQMIELDALEVWKDGE